MRVKDAINIEDLHTIAKRAIPNMALDAIDGGADNEVSLNANREAFDLLKFRPRSFVDVSSSDLTTSFFGSTVKMPLLFSPTGAGRLARRNAELIVADVASKHGLIYAHSSVASFTLEAVADVSNGGPLWFQLYIRSNRQETKEKIQQVQDAGYRALVLTVDTPVRGNRERDLRNGFTLPYKVTPRLILQGMSRPSWSTKFALDNFFTTRSGKEPARKRGSISIHDMQETMLAASYPVTWQDLEFVRSIWKGPLIVKGVMRADECEQMIDFGVDGVIVSNHGGRQLDGLPPAIEILPSVVDAVGDRLEVFVDGGIRRGTDVVKALALGARACLIGRPYLYAVAAGGGFGVTRLIEIFQNEIRRAMALLGCAKLSELDSTYIVKN